MRQPHGYSIIEVMVTLALASIIGFIGMKIADHIRRQELLARMSQSRSSLLNSVFSLSERATSMPKFSDFKSDSTYWLPRQGSLVAQGTTPIFTGLARLRNSGVSSSSSSGASSSSGGMDLKKIQVQSPPAQPLSLPTAGGSVSVYRDSSTLEINSIETLRVGGTEGFIASRCIPSSDAKKTEFTLADVLSYKMRPMVPYKSVQDGAIVIGCCPEGSNNLASCAPLDDPKQPWRLRVFHVALSYSCASGTTAGGSCKSSDVNLSAQRRRYNNNAVNVRVFPSQTELKDVSGVGFVASFDSDTAPDAISVQVFAINHECQRVIDTGIKPLNGKCNNDVRLDLKVIDKSITREVHSSGMLQLGH